MSPIVLVYLGLAFVAIGAALATLVFLAWALVGRSGERRQRRLRIARNSFLLFVAALLSAVSMYYLVLMPSIMTVSRPDFTPPLGWLSKSLAIIGPVLVFASVGLLLWLFARPRGKRRAAWSASLGCFVLFLAASAANYAVIYSIQVPAYERYVLIESHDWLTHVGDPAPDVTVVMLDGTRVRLSELRGKVVLVNFFATWCGPCRHELPHLQEMWTALKANDDFRMLVVARDESQETVAAFKSDSGYTFPMAVDPDAAAFHQFADTGIPRTYLISCDGTILYQSVGFADIDFYQKELARLQGIIDSELSKSRQAIAKK